MLSLAQSSRVYGQTLVTPTQPDNTWYRAYGGAFPNYIAGVNTAMIDYKEGPNSQPYGRLAVSDYFGNGTNGGVAFLDVISGQKSQFDYYLSFPGKIMGSSPDIVVGNSATNPLTDYIVAAAYLTPTAVHLVPQIDYYLVHYTSPGYFVAVPYSSTTFPVTMNSNAIHVDIISEAGNTTATGLPWCDKFVITISDAGEIYTYEASLNAPPATLTTALMADVTAGIVPDVAGIQRNVACSSCTPLIHDIALITYTDVTQQHLYYIEYDFAAGPSSIRTLDGGGAYSVIFPRIDAPDDYTINSTTTGNSYFKAVANQVPTSPGIVSSFSYDQTTGSSGWNNASFIPGGNLAPTVAFGGNNNTQYTIAHRNYISSSSPHSTYMEPIDWTLAAALAPPNDYFQVNTTPFSVTDFENGDYLSAISTPGNFPSDQTFVAWSIFDNTPDYSTVYYKSTGYSYAFRPGNTTAVANTTVKEWNVYPNPAESQLTVDNPIAEGARYEIIDMMGRTLINGCIKAGTQSIDLQALAPGSYVINLYDNDKRAYNKLFVKQ